MRLVASLDHLKTCPCRFGDTVANCDCEELVSAATLIAIKRFGHRCELRFAQCGGWCIREDVVAILDAAIP